MPGTFMARHHFRTVIKLPLECPGNSMCIMDPFIQDPIEGFTLTLLFPHDLPVMNGTQEEHKLSKFDGMSCHLHVSNSCPVRRDPDCEDACAVSQMSRLTLTLTKSPKKLPPPEPLTFGAVSPHLSIQCISSKHGRTPYF